MVTLRYSPVLRAIPLLISVCLFSFPAYAKYSGGTGEPNDPYQIATAEDLMLLGESPEDYDGQFILIADIDMDPNLPGRKVFDKAVIAVATHADADAVLATDWQKWHIPLADLQADGVNVASLKKMIICVGDRNAPQPGGTGRVYIDDIRLTKRMP
jgi:hypothetical protein